VREQKENPLDFALWKGEPEGEFWQSPWGFGRPGWHIECSVLAYKYLGQVIDIHGGGMYLIFPHHENEIAQSEAILGIPVVRYWLHNAFVNINKEKMSKSIGNFFTIKDVINLFDPMVLRFYYLQHHYRSPIDFSFEGLEAAKKAYYRLVAFFEKITETPTTYDSLLPLSLELSKSLCEDLNTPKSIGILFEHHQTIAHDPLLGSQIKWILKNIFGLTLTPSIEKHTKITPEIQKLIEERTFARTSKNWKRADEIRDILTKMGVTVHDTKTY